MWGFPGGAVVKNPPANAGDTGSILGQENPMREEMATHSSILAWRTSWTEKPGGLQSIESQESDMTWQLNHHPLYNIEEIPSIPRLLRIFIKNGC